LALPVVSCACCWAPPWSFCGAAAGASGVACGGAGCCCGPVWTWTGGAPSGWGGGETSVTLTIPPLTPGIWIWSSGVPGGTSTVTVIV
jgi:hypothetical protein